MKVVDGVSLAPRLSGKQFLFRFCICPPSRSLPGWFSRDRRIAIIKPTKIYVWKEQQTIPSLFKNNPNACIWATSNISWCNFHPFCKFQLRFWWHFVSWNSCIIDVANRYFNSGVKINGIVLFTGRGEWSLMRWDVFGFLQVEKNPSLCQVLSLPKHKSPVVSVDWSSSLSCYTCLTGSIDGSIQVTSLLKHWMTLYFNLSLWGRLCWGEYFLTRFFRISTWPIFVRWEMKSCRVTLLKSVTS